MAAYTDTLGFSKGSAGFDSRANNCVTKQEVLLDFAKIVAARAAAGVAALVAADTLQVLHIPAGSLLLGGGVEIMSAETVNTTATLGLGCTGGGGLPSVTASLLAAAAVTNAVGMTAISTISLAAPSVFVAADTLDLLLNTAVPTNAKVRVFALLANCN